MQANLVITQKHMEALKLNWITEGHLDFEYKKYLLLAYLQGCKKDFSEAKLYPPLSELVAHYRNLDDLKKDLEKMQQQFPKDLVGFDFEHRDLLYKSNLQADDPTTTITEILEFALPQVKETIAQGKELYDVLERHLELQPVGLVPFYQADGYLLLSEDLRNDVFIYKYHHSVIAAAGEHLQSISLSYQFTETRSISNTIEQIKIKLAKSDRELPNPATYFCLSKLQIPMQETLLPITKRLLLRMLSRY